MLLATLFTLLAPAQDVVPVIPKPNQIEWGQGSLELKPGLYVRFEEGLGAEARVLSDALSLRLDDDIKMVPISMEDHGSTAPDALGTPNQSIRLEWEDRVLGSEAYRITSDGNNLRILVHDTPGAFYAVQTLMMALPTSGPATFPRVQISDAPRFAWRGLHLDVGRHLFAVDDIKVLLDWMARLKFNRFHWHLSEDQGWRLEIRAYPKLTEVGAWRDATPPYGDRRGSDDTRYGGFYTQDQVREIVAYAAARHILVVPEIDMPGHMSAAIAAYPELGNSDIPGYAPKVQTHWGVHPYTLAPKEETFEWIDTVLGEVCELFPSPYIHIGGDEAPKDQWRQSAFAQSVMQREGLTDEKQLQAWFLARVSKMLEARGRKLLGWDEIREGGLVDGATVMVWRGWENAIEAARQGHDVVMAPGSHTYFDHYPLNPKSELAKGAEYECIGGFLPLEKVYRFEPVPSELLGSEAATYILGCQGQLWTEYIKTWDKLEYLAFPRAAALAEVAWTQPAERDWEDFQVRLEPFLERLQQAGVRYSDPNPEPQTTDPLK
ncbi:MAG: beta-N-acetylhexosaminidase [Planctomycetes bacterium]|nr:beta-N-acetylhexosaminidase [Planctomycetota bacterium]